MLESEAFKGQTIKVTSGIHAGKWGFLDTKGTYAACVRLEDADINKPFIPYIIAYEKLEPLGVNAPIDSDACCDSKDASVPNTKYYDEHYASMAV